jgi:hypothetical protein
MLTIENRREPEASTRADPEHEAESVRAWEQIEVGRYMPRRIRGSFPGRELG